MPKNLKAKHFCYHRGCPNVTREPYCEEHAALRAAQFRAWGRAKDRQRPSAAARGYGHHHRSARREYLRTHPTCAACGDRATVLDHIVPLRAGGTDHPSNYQALCRSCHARKTTRDTRKGGGGWKSLQFGEGGTAREA